MHDGFCSPDGRNGSGGGENDVSSPAAAAQSEEIEINETNFPDENFRKFVLTGYANFDSINGLDYRKIDYDGNHSLSSDEIDAVKAINCGGKEIGDLTGIGYFTALEKLECPFNQLTELDVSKNRKLVRLHCGVNQLTELDVSDNTALMSLNCDYNQLTKLQLTKPDAGNNTALMGLNCEGNQLTELDVSKNTALTWLSCSYNQLAKLDVSNNTALTFFDCDSNQLTELDVSKNTALSDLRCDSNQLTKLDVSKNTALTQLSCDSNQLTELDVSKNTALSVLGCNDNQLTELDVSKNTKLDWLYCGFNQLTKLDVSKNEALTWLSCSYNQLTSLDVEKTKAKTGQTPGLAAEGNSYNIAVDSNDQFDLSALSGISNFDVNKASNWTGGSVEGTILTVNKDANKVTYTYDCGTSRAGEEFFVEFTLNVPGHNVDPVDPDIPADGGDTDDAADNIKGALSAVVVGAVAGAIIYETGTGIYRVINMPGIPMPSNRGELATLLWEHAGKPEPVSTALYSDIDEDNIDLNKAARWAVEQGLMQDNSEKNTFNPRFPVSKLRTCLTWNAAKEKGLFDTNKTAE